MQQAQEFAESQKHSLPQQFVVERPYSISNALSESGFAVITPEYNYLFETDLVSALENIAVSLGDEAYEAAHVGRIDQRQRNAQIRSDEINWVTGSELATRAYLGTMERLRQHLNERLFLGLFEFESHFARYGEGAFYKRHRDSFNGGRNRVLSSVLYLNPDWRADQGGELVIYDPDDGRQLGMVSPEFGTLVLFLSEIFPHEVLPAMRTRFSLAGWFRINQATVSAAKPAKKQKRK